MNNNRSCHAVVGLPGTSLLFLPTCCCYFEFFTVSISTHHHNSLLLWVGCRLVRKIKNSKLCEVRKKFSYPERAIVFTCPRTLLSPKVLNFNLINRFHGGMRVRY